MKRKDISLPTNPWSYNLRRVWPRHVYISKIKPYHISMKYFSNRRHKNPYNTCLMHQILSCFIWVWSIQMFLFTFISWFDQPLFNYLGIDPLNSTAYHFQLHFILFLRVNLVIIKTWVMLTCVIKTQAKKFKRKWKIKPEEVA